MQTSWRSLELAFGSFHRQTSHKRPSSSTSRSLLFSGCFDAEACFALKCVFWPVPHLVTEVRSVRGMGTLRKMLLLLFTVIGSGQGWQTSGTRAFDGTRHNILGTSPFKTVCILIQNNKVQYEVLRTKASDRSQFSARFSQFKELSETLKLFVYPEGTSFNKLNSSRFN
ncbi:hypothetical protein TNCV_497661 [Trichonephila clavipes]|nr:hypothetical protein TNCV_497661 [Trichonephila clavipes]